MIISERHKFVFVHIPKCAGTTVREQLKSLDETGGAFTRVQNHAELGRIDFMHLPLRVLKDHFPDAFAQVERLDAYAVTRDPESRFRSSVSEYLKRVKNSRLAELSEEQLQAVIAEVISMLDARAPVPSYEIAHFIPQCDYIWLDGRLIVERTIALENIGELFSEIARRTNSPVDKKAWSNQDFVLRFEGFKKAIWNVNDLARGLLPYSAYQTLKRLARPVLVKERATPTADRVFRSETVRTFVRRYYADDFRQHDDDLAKAVPSPASFRARAARG